MVSYLTPVRNGPGYASKAEGVSSMRDVYSAVADPTRRQLLRLLAEADELPLNEMTARFPVGRTAVSKHLAILKEAGLVIDRKAGRETRYHLNAAPLREIQEWVSFYERFWIERIDLLKNLLEEENQ
jgi:DNA-binding transcriptional ArsR family regulator